MKTGIGPVRWQGTGIALALVLLLAGDRTWAASGGPSFQEDHRIRGQLQAPVTLIEYSDFTCGFCIKFFRETWPRLQARYVDTGKVRFVYRDYPRADRGPGLDAAVAARCAGDQGQYWAMHDRLFSEQGDLDTVRFVRYAGELGLDNDLFLRCLRERRSVEAILQDRSEANRWGFHGTPGFILMHTARTPTGKNPAVAIPGAFPFEFFAEEIDRLLQDTPSAIR